MMRHGHHIFSEMIPLRDEHLEDAAALVAARHRVAREHVPILPPRHEDPRSVLPLLRHLAGQSSGVAVVREGRLAGFLLGMALSEHRGKRAVYCPEWAHAADGRRMYEALYAHLAPQWLADGCVAHAITFLANEREAIDTWFWLGFGMTAVDAIRDLGPVAGPVARVEIRRAGPADVDVATALSEGLRQHMAGAPTFLHKERQGRRHHERWLANPANVLWLAYRDGEAVACLALEPTSPGAAYMVRDGKTVSITNAFTKEHARGSGVMAALLQHALDCARTAGYERCAVDFEPDNLAGTRFWLRHFYPACYSLFRCVDERFAVAREDRAVTSV